MYRLAGGSLRSGVKANGPDFTTNLPMCGGADNCYFVGPYDFATIYNVLPLWNATPPINGIGQAIAILNESNINLQDVRDFRNMFGLPANDPQVILNGPDPGLVPGVESEADLDVEWSGAVAKGATIELIVRPFQAISSPSSFPGPARLRSPLRRSARSTRPHCFWPLSATPMAARSRR